MKSLTVVLLARAGAGSRFRFSLQSQTKKASRRMPFCLAQKERLARLCLAVRYANNRLCSASPSGVRVSLPITTKQKGYPKGYPFYLAQKERLARLCLAVRYANNRLCSASPSGVRVSLIASSVKVFLCFPLAVPKEIFALLACSISLTAAPTRTPCIAHRARSCSLPAPEPALGSDFHYRAKQKRHPEGCLFVWRRRRDSNSRAGFPTYALSRGASSPT